ncbi:MAG TPA: MBL fold metallo-hydrolase, partial [Flavobacteriaceae bacterium]|nr:MBL fold metallo-hydrolase [Flavobacteriaceae bacterium]
LAKMMFNTIQTKFKDLPDNAYVYPAHGAGSLCGKGMSADASSSTLGNERISNWAFKNQTEEQFTEHLLSSQPFIPHYFGYNVAINKDGASNLSRSIGNIPLQLSISETRDDILVIDTRDESDFKKNHLPGSINIMATSETSKFETWLGSIVKPEEEFYVVVTSVEEANTLLNRIAKIGYEKQVKAIVTLGNGDLKTSPDFNISEFKENKKAFTIVDIRNDSEVEEGKIFETALTIPLHQLRERVSEIPNDKPIVVHCAGGYRSAAGSSILETELKNTTVFDLSDAVTEFQN